MKKQQTDWIWSAQYAKGGLIRVGWIHNKQKGCLQDVVRVEILSETEDIGFAMRIDEAQVLAAGIGKVLALQMLRDRVVLREDTNKGSEE